MLSIILLHKHYDGKHLEEVKSKMVKRGTPKIRCIWSEVYGCWMAVEGCHRLRAAQELGLTPIIKDISEQKTVSHQTRDGSVKMSMPKMIEFLQETAYKSTILDFKEDE